MCLVSCLCNTHTHTVAKSPLTVDEKISLRFEYEKKLTVMVVKKKT